MMLCAATPDTVALVLPIGLLVAGLVLIGAEFFLPTVVLGFIGAVISFAGIYLSAAAGALAFPVSHLLQAAASLVPTPRYFPLRLRCLRALVGASSLCGRYNRRTFFSLLSILCE